MTDPEEKLCENCGHKSEFHNQKDGQCMGDPKDGHNWCIGNCKRFWEN